MSPAFAALLGALAAQVELLPGDAGAEAVCVRGRLRPQPASRWPRFLFHFRHSREGLRLDEVRSVAAMLGWEDERFEISPTDGVSDLATSSAHVFHYVSLPDAAAAAAVARRCVTVRAAYQVWASLRVSGRRGDAAWQWARLAGEIEQHASPTLIQRMLAPMSDGGGWRADLFAFGRRSVHTLEARSYSTCVCS